MVNLRFACAHTASHSLRSLCKKLDKCGPGATLQRDYLKFQIPRLLGAFGTVERRPGFRPIQLPNVSRVIYDELRRRILHRQFAPGQQLNLREMETQLDVSRTPLKLALERLQLEGLVVIHPRRGTFVATFSADDIRQCFDLRIALEAQALRRAFEPHNRPALNELIRLFVLMDGYFTDEATWLDELPEYMAYDARAHLMMIGLGGNRRALECYEQANVQGYIAMMGARFRHADTLSTVAEHRTILNALQAGQIAALLDATREHLEQAGERAVRRLTTDEAPA